MGSTIDSLIGLGIIGTFLFIIGSRIYEHEKEHLDPLIKKVKGWFNKEDEGDDNGNEDFEIGFRGQ